MTATMSSNQQLAEILERQKLLPVTVLENLISRSRTLQEWLGGIAISDGLITPEELASAISRDKKISMANLKTTTPDIQALTMLEKDVCLQHTLFPVNYSSGFLAIAMANPLDETIIGTVKGLVNCQLNVMVAPATDINRAIEEWYSRLAAHPTPLPESARKDDNLVTKILHDIQPQTQVPEPDSASMDPNELTIDQLLFMMLEQRASDLHLAVGSPPMMRVDGELMPMPFPTLTPSSVQMMLYAILSDVDITTFERHRELDFAYSIPRVSRFRVNVHRQRGSVGAVLRTIPEEMPSLEKLGMPPIVHEMTERPRGLVLVTGPTGSGKSTTLAAMIDQINRTRRAHIVTIEDPIEFLHKNKMSVVTQREVGADTESFGIALRHVLRQDPDVILIGEMRDLETIGAAVTAAETGHLVFGTLHTTSASQTIERIIDVFPPHQQEQIRSQLSNTLEAIFTQTLLPKIDGKGRCCAQEILICTPAIRNLIREGKVHQMSSVLQASAKYGMQTLDAALTQLVLARKVTLEQAILKSSNPDDFKAMLAMQ